MPLPLHQFLFRALLSKFGIAVKTDNPKLLMQKLYAERRKSGDPRFADLILAESRTDPEGELWIINNAKETEPQDSSGGGSPL